MMSEKRTVDNTSRTAAGRVATGSAEARRRPLQSTLWARTLGPAILCLALAGCSVINGPASWSTRQSTTFTKPPARETKKPLFGSWFRSKEPEPLKTTNDWMALEQIRP